MHNEKIILGLNIILIDEKYLENPREKGKQFYPRNE